LPLDIEITDLDDEFPTHPVTIYQGSLLFIPTDSEGFWADAQLVYQADMVEETDPDALTLWRLKCPHCGYKY